MCNEIIQFKISVIHNIYKVLKHPYYYKVYVFIYPWNISTPVELTRHGKYERWIVCHWITPCLWILSSSLGLISLARLCALWELCSLLLQHFMHTFISITCLVAVVGYLLVSAFHLWWLDSPGQKLGLYPSMGHTAWRCVSTKQIVHVLELCWRQIIYFYLSEELGA